ncbi:hypothetical protein MIMGU_mgv1a0217652mg, partial [Erythranthe guttata]
MLHKNNTRDSNESAGVDDDDQDFQIEDLQDSTSRSSSSSSWKYMFRFKLLRNYYSRQEDSISTYSNTLDQTRRDHSHGFIIHPQNS